MEQLQVTAVFPAIADENREEFRQLAAGALADARGEAGTLQYDWFFSDDGTRCVVREIYADSQAVFVHLGNVGDALGRLVELGGGLELEVFGDPSPELREAIAAFQPRIYAYAQGK